MGEITKLHELKSSNIMAKPRFRWDKKDKFKNLVQSMLSYKLKVEFDARTTSYGCKRNSNIAVWKTSFWRNCLYFGDAIFIFLCKSERSLLKELNGFFTNWPEWKYVLNFQSGLNFLYNQQKFRPGRNSPCNQPLLHVVN